MYKLLYNNQKKKSRKEIKPCKMSKETYELTDRIKQLIGDLPEDESLRIRLIRNEPVIAYRVSILKKYNHPHTVKSKDGLSVMLKPGLYVKEQYWCENQKDGLVFTPPLKECVAHGNA